MRRLGLFVFLALASASGIAACGGGSSTGVPGRPDLVTSSSVVTVNGATQAVIANGGYKATVTLPAPANGATGTVIVGMSQSPPGGVQAPASLQRRAQSTGTSLTPLVYISITPSVTLTFPSVPSLTFTLPPAITPPLGTNTAFVGFFDPAASTTGWVTVLGPGTVNGQSVAFQPYADAVTLTAGTTYVFALFTSVTTPVINAAQGATYKATPSAFTITALNTPSSSVTVSRTDGGQMNVTPMMVTVANPTTADATCNSVFTFRLQVNQPLETAQIVQFQPYPASKPQCALNFTTVAGPGAGKFIAIPINGIAPPAMVLSPSAITPGYGLKFAATVVVSETNGTAPNLVPSFTASCSPYFTAVVGTPMPNGSAVPVSVFQNASTTAAQSQPPANSGCNPATLTLTDATSATSAPVVTNTAAPTTFSLTPATAKFAGVGSAYAVSLTAADSNGPFVLASATAAPSPAVPSPSATACPYSFSQTTGASTLINVYVTQAVPGTCAFTVTDMFSGTSQSVTLTLPTGNVTIGGQ